MGKKREKRKKNKEKGKKMGNKYEIIIKDRELDNRHMFWFREIIVIL